MDQRYIDPIVAKGFSHENKTWQWQKTELAVIEARVKLGMLSREIFHYIQYALLQSNIDIEWWLQKEKELNHDLGAFVAERRRHLHPSHQRHFHEYMTSYDTEEPAFARMLSDALSVLETALTHLQNTLVALARQYRYTIMMARTHGQWAELQSFGKRCLTWLVALRLDIDLILQAKQKLVFSKISGVIGNYGSISPELEKEALAILGLKPFYGATQIMPRELYAPLAQGMCNLVLTIDKIANDIRLGARSGTPICQEPFGKKGMGSSAMPFKKNTIASEQEEGMGEMAKGFCQMIVSNIKTWEERCIRQSCVERVAWPDLFHVAVHSVKNLTRTLAGLQVYPDNMMQEIIDSRGCYAGSAAKEFLSHHGAPFGLLPEDDAYRIVQLAAFNAFEPRALMQDIRDNPPNSFDDFEKKLAEVSDLQPLAKQESIKDIIVELRLRRSKQLAATPEQIERWYGLLEKIFAQPGAKADWFKLFKPVNLLQGEATLYKEILGE